jgi:hypothetical protein
MRWREGINYGAIWNYVPLKRITGVSVTGREEDTFSLSIHLPGDDRIEYLLSTSNRHAADMLVGYVENLSPRSGTGRPTAEDADAAPLTPVPASMVS